MVGGPASKGPGAFGFDLRKLAQSAAAEFKKDPPAPAPAAPVAPVAPVHGVGPAAVIALSRSDADAYLRQLPKLLAALPLGPRYYDPKTIDAYLRAAAIHNTTGRLATDVLVSKQTGMPLASVFLSTKVASDPRFAVSQGHRGDVFESSSMTSRAHVDAALSERVNAIELPELERQDTQLVDFDPKTGIRTFRLDLDTITTPPSFQRISLEIVQGPKDKFFVRDDDGKWRPSRKLKQRLDDLVIPPFNARFVTFQKDVGVALRSASCSTVGPAWFVGAAGPGWAAPVVGAHPGSMVLNASFDRFVRTSAGAGRGNSEDLNDETFFSALGWGHEQSDLLACAPQLAQELEAQMPDDVRVHSRTFAVD